jgi:hypothetical protein
MAMDRLERTLSEIEQLRSSLGVVPADDATDPLPAVTLVQTLSEEARRARLQLEAAAAIDDGETAEIGAELEAVMSELAALERFDDGLDTAVVKTIHAAGKQSGARMVLVATGAGGHAIATLLGVAGASSTILEATVPYAQEALSDYIGHTPEVFVAPETASSMAVAALLRGSEISYARDPSGGLSPIGVGVTAAIATDRTRRGLDRCIVATARLRPDPDSLIGDDAVVITTHDLIMAKGAKNALFEPCLWRKRSFHQYRLGTNILICTQKERGVSVQGCGSGRSRTRW